MSRLQARALIGGCLAFMVLIWVVRRPDQFTHPYMWIEESVIFDNWQREGFLNAVFTPVQGYLLLISSLSASLIFSFSFLDFPALAWIAGLGWYLVLPLLWLLPGSRLSFPMRLAFTIAPVLAPTGPEVFGVLLYAFWWAMLWPVAVLFWDSPKWLLRIPVLLLAGLSSLSASGLFVAFAFQWWMKRRREDAVSALILFGTSVAQAVIYLSSERSREASAAVLDIAEQSVVNIGKYPLAWLETADYHYLAFIGICGAAAMLFLAWYSRKRDPEFWSTWGVLLIVLGVFTVASSAPAPGIADTTLSGVRYFFLPFTAITWLAITLIFSRWKEARTIGVAVLVAGLISLAPVWNPTIGQEKLDWQGGLITACQRTDGPAIVPIQYDGLIQDAWKLELTDKTCDKVFEKTGAKRVPVSPKSPSAPD